MMGLGVISDDVRGAGSVICILDVFDEAPLLCMVILDLRASDVGTGEALILTTGETDLVVDSGGVVGLIAWFIMGPRVPSPCTVLGRPGWLDLTGTAVDVDLGPAKPAAIVAPLGR